MTATNPDLLEDLVEGSTYMLGTGDCGDGVMWTLSLLGQPDPEFAGQLPDGFQTWNPVATRETARPVNGHYRESARGWLRTLGLDPDGIDIVMVLPDGYERLRP